MLTCFETPMRITQKFGNDFLNNGKYYYKSYGLLGHNGLDVIPTGKNWLIYNFIGGRILKIERHKAYGNRICIWNRAKKLAEYHNHLEFINPKLKKGGLISPHTIIGKMGNSGACFGKNGGYHDHIAFVATDEDGYRINKNNGYGGYIDPVEILEGIRIGRL